MQLLEHYDPLNLPRGSVRALVTLALLGVLWTLMYMTDRNPDMPLGYLVLLVLGHYFGSLNLRSPAGEGRKVRGPLGLPFGTIRTIIVLGFATVAWFLWTEGRLEPSMADSNTMILFTVGALITGLVVRMLTDAARFMKVQKPVQWFENGKSLLVLLAAGLLCTCSVLGPGEVVNENLTLVSAPIVGLYYGSRR